MSMDYYRNKLALGAGEVSTPSPAPAPSPAPVTEEKSGATTGSVFTNGNSTTQTPAQAAPSPDNSIEKTQQLKKLEQAFNEYAKSHNLPKDINMLDFCAELAKQGTTYSDQEQELLNIFYSINEDPNKTTNTKARVEEMHQLQEAFEKYSKTHNVPEDLSIEDFCKEIVTQGTEKLSDDELYIVNTFNKLYKTDKSEQTAQNSEPQKKEIEPETQKRLDEYKKIMADNNPNMTPYAKNSKIMDIYLSEHDPKYQSLKTPQQKQQYRDEMIHNFMDALSAGQNITQAQRKNNQLDMAKVFINCEYKGENALNVLKGNPAAIKNKVMEINKKSSEIIREKLQDIDTKELLKLPPEEALFVVGKTLLAKDPKFKALGDDVEKQKEYINNNVRQKFQSVMGIDITSKDITDKEKEIMLKTSVYLYESILALGVSDAEFINNSVSQARVINKLFENHPELMQDLPDTSKASMQKMQTKANIVIQLSANNNGKQITEGEIYKELRNNMGKLNEYEKQLLEDYAFIDTCKNNGVDVDAFLSEPAGISSVIGKATLLGMDVPRYYEMKFSQCKNEDGTINYKKLEEILSRSFDEMHGNIDSLPDALLVKNAMVKLGIPKERIDELCTRTNKYETLNIVYGARHDIPELAIDAANSIASYGTQEQQANAGKAIRHAIAHITEPETGAAIWCGMNDVAINSFGNDFATGMNAHSVAFCTEAMSAVINTPNVPENRISALSTSLVTTCSTPARQLEMGQSLSSLDNKAVNEGLAAAEPYVDNSVRSSYSQSIDNSINRMEKSGKYSKEEISQMKSDIKQARETGMTKAEQQTAKKIQQEVKTANQKTQEQHIEQKKLEAKIEHQTLVEKKQQVINFVKEVMTHALTSSLKTNSSLSTPTKDSIDTEQEIKVISQTLEKIEATSSINESHKLKETLLRQIEDFQAKIRQSQEEWTQKITEREVLNSFVTDSEVSESDASEEVVAVAADSEKKPADAVDDKASKASGLSKETVAELREAYKTGGITKLYEKAVTLVGTKAQEKLLNYISHTSSSTLHSFADSYSGNKNVLMTLFRNSKDPYIMQLLIRNGYASEILNSGEITVKDFVSNASPTTITNWISDLQKIGATYTLKEAYEHLGNISHDIIADMGSDDWNTHRYNNMALASNSAISSDTYDSSFGQTESTILPSWQARKNKRGPFHLIG